VEITKRRRRALKPLLIHVEVGIAASQIFAEAEKGLTEAEMKELYKLVFKELKRREKAGNKQMLCLEQVLPKA